MPSLENPQQKTTQQPTAGLAAQASQVLDKIVEEDSAEQAYLQERDQLTILVNIYREIAAGDDKDFSKIAKKQLGKIPVKAEPEDVDALAFAWKRLGMTPDKFAAKTKTVARALRFLAAHDDRHKANEAYKQAREAYRNFEREMKTREHELFMARTRAEGRDRTAGAAAHELKMLARQMPPDWFEGARPPRPRAL